MKGVVVLVALGAFCFTPACRDLSGFNTNGGSYQGAVIAAPFVLAGIANSSTTLCLTLDTNHLQDTPGSIWTSDGRFMGSPMRSIPQIWQDPLSTFQFGDGRLKNMMYMARATVPFDDGDGNDVLTVVSLMQSGDIEVRLIRGAPILAGDGGAGPAMQNVFAIFDLTKQSSPCSL
jgi:hypothetical protein